MKKITLIMSLAIASLTLMAQNPVDRVFQKYANAEGVTSVQLSKGMMNMLASFDPGDENLKKLAASISSINILHLAGISGNNRIDVYDEVLKDLPVSRYNELMRVNSSDQKVLFLVDESDGIASEFLMIVGGGGENVLISIKGSLNISELSSLAQIDVPGMSHLINLQK